MLQSRAEYDRSAIRFTETPRVILLGASHWQEASSRLFPRKTFYNAHVHRDYIEDVMALTEILIENNRLPETLIISVRDLTFSPVDMRTDSLWLSFVPEYRAMAKRLGIPSHPWIESSPARHWLGLASFSALPRLAVRWLTSDAKPGPTNRESLETLDILSVDGSVRWSRRNLRLFAGDRARREASKELEHRSGMALEIDPNAIVAMERLLGLLRENGVSVVLVHTPLHPALYEGLAGTPYAKGLLRVETETLRLADAQGAVVAGSFDPARVGCVDTMYIDAEHTGPDCLKFIVEKIPGLAGDEPMPYMSQGGVGHRLAGRKSQSESQRTATQDRRLPR